MFVVDLRKNDRFWPRWTWVQKRPGRTETPRWAHELELELRFWLMEEHQEKCSDAPARIQPQDSFQNDWSTLRFLESWLLSIRAHLNPRTYTRSSKPLKLLWHLISNPCKLQSSSPNEVQHTGENSMTQANQHTSPCIDPRSATSHQQTQHLLSQHHASDLHHYCRLRRSIILFTT